MNEVSTSQIATALAGHPGDPSVELHVLMLFQSAGRNHVEVGPEALGEPSLNAGNDAQLDLAILALTKRR
jgi:hypothetical protein